MSTFRVPRPETMKGSSLNERIEESLQRDCHIKAACWIDDQGHLHIRVPSLRDWFLARNHVQEVYGYSKSDIEREL